MAIVVLLPGMDGTGSLFSDFVSALPPTTKAVIVSYPATEALGYAELERVASAKLPAQPFILIGESFSGPIAIALAAAAPSGLRGVVLVCSFARAPMPAFMGSVLSRLPFWRMPIRLAAAALLGSKSTPAHRARLSAAMAGVVPAAWRARLAAVFSVNVVAKLRSVKVPLLYLSATEDWIVPRAAWEEIKSSLPSSRIAELEGPHFLLQANPVESAARITAFAKELGFAL